MLHGKDKILKSDMVNIYKKTLYFIDYKHTYT